MEKLELLRGSTTGDFNNFNVIAPQLKNIELVEFSGPTIAAINTQFKNYMIANPEKRLIDQYSISDIGIPTLTILLIETK